LRRTAVIVDEQPVWLSGIESVLSRVDVQVVGRATRLSDGTGLVQTVRPDLVVASIDARDDELDGLGFLRRIRGLGLTSRVIAFSTSGAAQDIDDALRAGAVAYIVKTARPEDFAATVRQAFQPSIFLERPVLSEPAAAQRARPVARANGEAARPPSPAPEAGGLTRRELETLRLVADGATNSDVARALRITEQTVKFHLSNIYRKLGVSNRTGASRWARVNALISRGSGQAPDALASVDCSSTNSRPRFLAA
jgi:DNA-binding NarL/FixJ family response regulator